MLAATKSKKSGRKKEGDQVHVRHFLHKTCNQEVSRSFTSCKTTTRKCTKNVCWTCEVAFFGHRPIVAFSLFSLPSPLSISRLYILFEQTINIIESFAFYPWLNLYSLRCSRLSHSSKPFYIVCLRVSAQMLVLISCRVART